MAPASPDPRKKFKNPISMAGQFIQDLAKGIDSAAADIDASLQSFGMAEAPEAPPEEPEAEQPLQSVTNVATLAWQLDHLLDDVLHLEVDHLPHQGMIDGKPCDCLRPGTLVYAGESARSIGHMERNTAAFTHEGRYQRVTETMSRHYSGELVSLRPYYIDSPLLLTPNHTVYAVKDRVRGQALEKNLDWFSSKDLGYRDLMAFPRLLHSQDIEVVNNDLAELFGWYVAEGCKDKLGNRIVFSLGKHEAKHISRIQEIIRRQFGVEPRSYDRPTSVHITFSHRSFSPMFESFGRGARNKIAPPWLLYLPFEKQYAFLRGLISGDGSIDSHSITIATTSPNLAAQLRLLLFRLGLLHGFSKRDLPDTQIEGRIIKANGPLYSLRIAGEAAVDLASKCRLPYRMPLQRPTNYGCVVEGYVLYPIKDIGLEAYEGPVHNMEVETDNTYVTLQGAIHNCIAKGGRELRRHAMETIPIAARQGTDPEIFSSLAKWANHIMDIGTLDAVQSGEYDAEYLAQAGNASNIRKQLESMLAELRKTYKQECATCPSLTSLKDFMQKRREGSQK